MHIGMLEAEQVPYLVRHCGLEVVARDAGHEDAEVEEGRDEEGQDCAHLYKRCQGDVRGCKGK